MSDLSFTEVGEILRLLQGFEGTLIELEWGDFKLQVRRDGSVEGPQAGAISRSATASQADASGSDKPATSPPLEAPEGKISFDRTSTGEPPSEPDIPAHWIAVRAPMVGTLYNSPKAGEPPYVQVGDLVAVGDTVALVEVMKLFTELKSEAAGKVARIDGIDGTMVEFGEALIWIEPT